MSATCIATHDSFTARTTFGLCCYLFISYAIQHHRIMTARSSDGLSPWYLLLGVSASTSSFFNIVTLQWGIVRCCSVFTLTTCLEMVGGIILIAVPWAMVSFTFLLYMLYYPEHLKYRDAELIPENKAGVESHAKIANESSKRKRLVHWKLSIILSWVAVIYIILIAFITYSLLRAYGPNPTTLEASNPPPQIIYQWANLLGITAAVFSATHWLPQILLTYRAKLVKSLSIPTLCLQAPSMVVMGLNIAVRPGTNWTSWATMAAAGQSQIILLLLCLAWKVRQRALRIDDFGKPLEHDEGHESPSYGACSSSETNVPRPDSAMINAQDSQPHPQFDVGALTLIDEDGFATRAALVGVIEPAATRDRDRKILVHKPAEQQSGWIAKDGKGASFSGAHDSFPSVSELDRVDELGLDLGSSSLVDPQLDPSTSASHENASPPPSDSTPLLRRPKGANPSFRSIPDSGVPTSKSSRSSKPLKAKGKDGVVWYAQ